MVIQCEGIKAFRGSATIKPRNDTIRPFTITGDWVFKPDTGCWYCNGRSFTENIVTDIHEDVG